MHRLISNQLDDGSDVFHDGRLENWLILMWQWKKLLASSSRFRWIQHMIPSWYIGNKHIGQVCFSCRLGRAPKYLANSRSCWHDWLVGLSWHMLAFIRSPWSNILEAWIFMIPRVCSLASLSETSAWICALQVHAWFDLDILDYPDGWLLIF